MYKTKAWRMKSKYIRERDEYLCQHCLRTGYRIDGREVHHVNPLRERPDLALDERNLILLCAACHNRMEDRTAGRLTREGEKLRARINRKYGITPPSIGITTKNIGNGGG